MGRNTVKDQVNDQSPDLRPASLTAGNPSPIETVVMSFSPPRPRPEAGRAFMRYQYPNPIPFNKSWVKTINSKLRQSRCCKIPLVPRHFDDLQNSSGQRRCAMCWDAYVLAVCFCPTFPPSFYPAPDPRILGEHREKLLDTPNSNIHHPQETPITRSNSPAPKKKHQGETIGSYKTIPAKVFLLIKHQWKYATVSRTGHHPTPQPSLWRMRPL
ncbi:hypothetical protein QBC44DRAFT_102227 [Cladorrhinum sp. PSN332]|nr:hypothetical protein QBC44DRAFT_102227 [Cladorrhinum sp. PSN332]